MSEKNVKKDVKRQVKKNNGKNNSKAKNYKDKSVPQRANKKTISDIVRYKTGGIDGTLAGQSGQIFKTLGGHYLSRFDTSAGGDPLVACVEKLRQHIVCDSVLR